MNQELKDFASFCHWFNDPLSIVPTNSGWDKPENHRELCEFVWAKCCEYKNKELKELEDFLLDG
jgi:hypothetical protein